MPTWSDIQLWNSEALSSYAETLNSRKQTIDQQVATLENRQNSFQGEGQTADALRSAMGTAHAALRGISEQMEGVRSAITKAVSSVQGVESLVSAALSAASARHCRITDAGTVVAHLPHQAGLSDKSSEVVPLVRRALAEAEKVDDAFYALLRTTGLNVSSAKYSNIGVHALSAVEQETFKNMPTEERARYWSQQSPEQKRFLCDTYPELIGNADGVEAWARDRANRLRLPKLKQAAQNEVNEINSELKKGTDSPARYVELQERLTKAQARLDAYKKIEEKLTDWGPIDPNVKDGTQVGFSSTYGKQRPGYLSLLTLQEENGRVLAAVAQGDVDHAKNVATVVPGIGTTVEKSLESELTRGANLRNAAAAEGNIDTKDVAVVSWLGYEAPPAPSKDLGEDLKIVTMDLAEKGSDKLAGFLTGVNASRIYGAGDANMTLLGHSYGSVVSGRATTKIADGVVDNEILFGSPGMGTYDPSEIHVPEGRRFVSGVPKGDWVQGASDDRWAYYLGLGVLNPLLIPLEIPAEIHAELSGVGQLGMDPMNHDSTFIPISSDATGSYAYADGLFDAGSKTVLRNHSVYMDPGTGTLRDMGRIVAGQDPRRYYYDYPLTKPTPPLA